MQRLVSLVLCFTAEKFLPQNGVAPSQLQVMALQTPPAVSFRAQKA